MIFLTLTDASIRNRGLLLPYLPSSLVMVTAVRLTLPTLEPPVASNNSISKFSSFSNSMSFTMGMCKVR